MVSWLGMSRTTQIKSSALGGQGLDSIQPVVELTGLVRSPLARLRTDGPCYALVVLLVGNSRDTIL